MNEDYDYYVNCKYRKRNYGLFTADQVSFYQSSKTIAKYVLTRRFFNLTFEFEHRRKVIPIFPTGTFTWLKLTMETSEQCLKSIQS